MARSASTQRRPAARRPGSPSPRRRPKRGRGLASARGPLLSLDLKRELIGVSAIGIGLILAAVLLLPGSGALARPMHDALYAVLGAGAWLAVAALIVTGARVCVSHEWRAGEAAAAGSVLGVLALLGLTGLIAPGSAGDVGRWLGPGIARGLGNAGAGAALIAVAAFGLVMAMDLRVVPIVRAAAAWLGRMRDVDSAAPVATPPSRQGRFAGRDPVAELPGVAMPLPFETPVSGTTPPEAYFPDLDRPPVVPHEEPEHGAADVDAVIFPREFEGVATPGPLGPVPELT